MEEPSTPPASLRFGRLKTPPTPFHGPVLDTYEPYSPPRRSTRSTLQSNPYSSANVSTSSSFRSLPSANNIPPLTLKHPAARKLSFSISEALSTPPASPMQPRPGASTGRDNGNDPIIVASETSHSMTNSLVLPTASAAMLPTPSKTPSLTPARKHQRATSLQDSARILHFQPEDPNDVMPTPREARKQKSTLTSKMGDFDLHSPSSKRKASSGFRIYTEMQARVPEDDSSHDNVFRGRRTKSASGHQRARQWSSSPSPERRAIKTKQDVDDEHRMDLAAQRNEGAIYVFRGRKVYRRFDDVEAASSDLGDSSQQRALKRAAGETAQRPLTRSQITPRLLWPAHPHELEIDQGANIRQHDTADEEAETDIDMSDAPAAGQLHQQTPQKSKTPPPIKQATPAKVKTRTKPMVSPPTTLKSARSKQMGKILSFEDTLEADDEAAAPILNLPSPQRSSRKKKGEINHIPIFHDGTPEPVSPDKVAQAALAPPTPVRSKTQRVSTHLTPIVEDGEESSAPSPAPARTSGRRKVPSPFDNWPRTKAGRKREGEAVDTNSTGVPTKRSRSGTRSGQL